jgi:hypothetical protein
VQACVRIANDEPDEVPIMGTTTFRLALLLLAFAAPVAAQSNTDIITGRVTGPAGEPISGASIRATSLETGIERATLSNAQGRYTLVFPQGGGQYQLEISALGLGTVSRPLARIGDEEVLVAEVQMDIDPITLQGVEVIARRQPMVIRGEPGAQERVMSSEMLDRLPIDPNDLAAIAALTPGVVALADSLGMAGFSVLGQGPAGNQITLDGMSFDGGGMGTGVPQEAVRATRVITNTYDVSRGQFSGGQIATTTRGGTNQVQGTFNYSLRDPNLMWAAGDNPFGGTFRQNRISGGVGGPIIRNRLFYFGSLQYQRRSEGIQSLLSADALSLQRLGASPDSVGRFLSVLSGVGMYNPGAAIPSTRENDNLTFLGRVDYSLTDMHNLVVRGDARRSQQDNFRGGALGLPQSSGSAETSGSGLMATATSRFGNGWINELRAYVSRNERESVPNLILPDGRVRVSSDLDDGTRGIATFSFGGGGTESRSTDRTVEVSNELSLLLGLSHRVRFGGLLNSTGSTQEMASNRYGTFTFNSLEAFEAGRPSSFTRSLTDGSRRSGGLNAALYAGDTWRATDRLQLTYGLRLEGSRVGEQPQYNPLVEELFGRRTDAIPSELRVSPRVGFSYTVSPGTGFGGGGGFPAGGMRGTGGMAAGLNAMGATVIRGGFGEFRGRPAWSLFSAATDATGLPTAQSQLYCVGAAVPVPDWDGYLLDPGLIPTSCIGAPTLAPVSGRGTSVMVFDPDFGAARSWRASLGFQRRLLGLIGMSADATYALGVGQQGMRDLNLNTTPAFALAAEGGRPVFAAAQSVVPETGEIGFLASRLRPEFGQVSEIHSELRSRSSQFTLSLNGAVPTQRIFFSTSYTYARSSDQGSGGGWGAGFGGLGFGGGGGFGGGAFGGGGGGGFASLPLSAGNPNVPEWGRSDFERRHSLMTMVNRGFGQALNVSLIGRATSGSPYTPLVGGDINGDGARNDPAFIFNPANVADGGFAAAMARLLETVPGRARDCLASQLGQIAARNSCSSPWTYSLDLRAQIQPDLPEIGRRLAISIDATNTLAGIDQLLNGSQNLRGWGQQSRVDPTLMYPRGFDPVSRSFRYELNERFGAPRPGGLAIRNPFQIQVAGRLAVGPERGQGFGGMGVILRGMGGGAGGGPGGLLGRGAPNPLASILEMRDTLELTAEQVTRLEEVSRAFSDRQDRMQEEMGNELRQAFQRNPATAMQALAPRLEELRQVVAEALEEAQGILTAEQWERVPEDLRQPPSLSPGFGGRGDGQGRGGRGQGGPAIQRGERGGQGGPAPAQPGQEPRPPQ